VHVGGGVCSRLRCVGVCVCVCVCAPCCAYASPEGATRAALSVANPLPSHFLLAGVCVCACSRCRHECVCSSRAMGCALLDKQPGVTPWLLVLSRVPSPGCLVCGHAVDAAQHWVWGHSWLVHVSSSVVFGGRARVQHRVWCGWRQQSSKCSVSVQVLWGQVPANHAAHGCVPQAPQSMHTSIGT
jgi:hypothetical protein